MELVAVTRMRGTSVHDVMLDPQRLAWDVSALRGARARRKLKADFIKANQEDVVTEFLYEIYVNGSDG